MDRFLGHNDPLGREGRDMLSINAQSFWDARNEMTDLRIYKFEKRVCLPQKDCEKSRGESLCLQLKRRTHGESVHMAHAQRTAVTGGGASVFQSFWAVAQILKESRDLTGCPTFVELSPPAFKQKVPPTSSHLARNTYSMIRL